VTAVGPTRGIPDPGGVSGTFAALERTTPIVQSIDGAAPTTTTMRIANGTNNEHASVLRLVRDNLSDFEEFGLVGFQIAPRPAGQHGGGDVTIAILNEEHATLLLTYMRNNDVVRDFKKRLVREFCALRRHVAPLSDDEIMHQALTISAKRVELLTERVAELEPPAAAWNELAKSAGDYSVADAAKVLSRDAAIDTGERRLFKFMQGLDWIYRRDGHWCAKQSQITVGRLVEKVGSRYWHEGREEWVVPAPTVRVTPKGLQELHRRLGGGSTQLALAVAE
jgi:phage regulator Rha-like protein